MTGEPRTPIAAISIAQDGRFVVRPALTPETDFAHIYLAAKRITWDGGTRSLMTPQPRERTYADAYEDLCRAVLEEYGQRLVLLPSTEWVNVPEDVRRELLMRNLQLDVKLRYVSQRTGPRTNWKPLYVGLCGLAMSFTAAGLAFSIDYRPGNPWAYAALGIGVFGWVVVVAGIACGWFSTFRQYRR